MTGLCQDSGVSRKLVNLKLRSGENLD